MYGALSEAGNDVVTIEELEKCKGQEISSYEKMMAQRKYAFHFHAWNIS